MDKQDEFMELPQIVIGRKVRFTNAVIELTSFKVDNVYDPNSKVTIVGRIVTNKFFEPIDSDIEWDGPIILESEEEVKIAQALVEEFEKQYPIKSDRKRSTP